MSERLEELARRRELLQARCEDQRRQLGVRVAQLEHQAAALDTGVRLVRRFATSPLLIGVAVAVLAFVGPARLLRWAGQGLLVISAARRLTRIALP